MPPLKYSNEGKAARRKFHPSVAPDSNSRNSSVFPNMAPVEHPRKESSQHPPPTHHPERGRERRIPRRVRHHSWHHSKQNPNSNNNNNNNNNNKSSEKSPILVFPESWRILENLGESWRICDVSENRPIHPSDARRAVGGASWSLVAVK